MAPILYQNCAACHRPGDAAPFSLLTYEDARDRAVQIADVVRTGFMPPWLPQESEPFANARRLESEEIEELRQWAEAGAPAGQPVALPAIPEFVGGWRLGKPDLVLESAEYKVPAGGADEFRNFVMETDLADVRWVEAIEIQPVNAQVAHHARLGIDDSYESKRRDADDPLPGYAGMAWGHDPDGQLITWAPGMQASVGVADAAWRLYPQTCLVLHAHLQPTGKPETVSFRLGLHFAKQPPRRHPLVIRIGSRDIDIPAGASAHIVDDQYLLPAEVDVHIIFPHAHSLCQSMLVTAEMPNGETKTLITIEHFDENWHDNYRFKKPLRLSAGTKLLTRFVYNNTDQNVRNRRKPAQRVVYGSNAQDEMQDVYLQVTLVHDDQRAMLLEDYERYELKSKRVGYERNLNAYPEDPYSLEGLAACLVKLNDTQSAIALLQKRQAQDPESVYTTAALAMALLAAGQPQEAERIERAAILQDAEYPLAWLGLGQALQTQGETEEALRCLRRTLQLAPGLVSARLSLAALLDSAGRVEESIQAYQEVTRVAPDLPQPYLNLAEIYAQQGKFDQCRAQLELAVKRAPYTHPPKVLMAVYRLKNREPEQARQLLQEADKEMPQHPVVKLFLAQFAMREADYEAARRFLTAAASAKMPENWPASHRTRFRSLLESEQARLLQQMSKAAKRE